MVEVAKELECSAVFDAYLGTRVQPSAKELKMLRNCSVTPAILNGSLMNAIGVEYEHLGMTRNWVRAGRHCVIKLDYEAERLQ